MTTEGTNEALVFRNKGALDLNFIRVMGVSVKEKENAIGFFGTGLKYAIATIMRLGGEIEIYTGGKLHSFTCQTLEIRGETFEQVCMNGEPLGFTTQLGRQWIAWMAVRELYSNTLDEGGTIKLYDESEGSVISQSGETWIVVRGKPFIEVWRSKHEFFIQQGSKPLHSGAFCDTYAGFNGSSIYYKGIRVGETPSPTFFKHNIKIDMRLTEDRTLAWSWEFNEALEKSVITSDDPDFIYQMLTCENEYFEHRLSFADKHSDVEPSNTFVETIKTLSTQQPKWLNRSAVSWCYRRTNSAVIFEPHEPSKIQMQQLARAVDCMQRMGFGGDLETYPIKIVRWLGASIHGLAKNGTIYLSKECFDRGTKYVFSVLLEEFVHCHYGYADHTRELQTWLFDRIITLAEEFVVKEPI